MSLANEMQQLTRQLEEGTEARSAYEATRQAGAEEYMDDLRRGVAGMLEGFDAAHRAMAGTLRQRLSDDETGRQAEADKYMDDLRHNVAGMLQDFDAAHQAMANELRQQMSDDEASRRTIAEEYMDNLRRDVAGMLKDFDTAHQAMADELRQRLSDDETGRRAEAEKYMNDLRRDIAAFQTALQADFEKARRAWNDFSERMARRRGKKPARARKAAAPRPSAKASPDDFTVIQGIGPAMQERLTAAGITTYAQVARSAPETLRGALGEAARLADVDAWIAQARDLVEKK